MKVYVVTRYWNNDEGYPEDSMNNEIPVRVFSSLDKAIEYLKNLKVSDILSENENKEGWALDKCYDIFTKDLKYPMVASRPFHATGPVKPPYEEYREMANYEFEVYEIDME